MLRYPNHTPIPPTPCHPPPGSTEQLCWRRRWRTAMSASGRALGTTAWTRLLDKDRFRSSHGPCRKRGFDFTVRSVKKHVIVRSVFQQWRMRFSERDYTIRSMKTLSIQYDTMNIESSRTALFRQKETEKIIRWVTWMNPRFEISRPNPTTATTHDHRQTAIQIWHCSGVHKER